MGLGTALATAPREVHELAAATNTQPAGLEKLLLYLETLDMVSPVASAQWQLTDSGRILADEATIERLSADNQRNHAVLAALVHLRAALVDGYHPGVADATQKSPGLGTPTTTAALNTTAGEPGTVAGATDSETANNVVIPVTAELARRDDGAAIEYLHDLYRTRQQAGADSLRLACQCRLPDFTDETGAAARSAASRSTAARSNAERALVTFALYGDQLRSVEELYYLFGRAGLPAPTVGKNGSAPLDDDGYRVFEFLT